MLGHGRSIIWCKRKWNSFQHFYVILPLSAYARRTLLELLERNDNDTFYWIKFPVICVIISICQTINLPTNKDKCRSLSVKVSRYYTLCEWFNKIMLVILNTSGTDTTKNVKEGVGEDWFVCEHGKTI